MLGRPSTCLGETLIGSDFSLSGSFVFGLFSRARARIATDAIPDRAVSGPLDSRFLVASLCFST